MPSSPRRRQHAKTPTPHDREGRGSGCLGPRRSTVWRLRLSAPHLFTRATYARPCMPLQVWVPWHSRLVRWPPGAATGLPPKRLGLPQLGRASPLCTLFAQRRPAPGRPAAGRCDRRHTRLAAAGREPCAWLDTHVSPRAGTSRCGGVVRVMAADLGTDLLRVTGHTPLRLPPLRCTPDDEARACGGAVRAGVCRPVQCGGTLLQRVVAISGEGG